MPFGNKARYVRAYEFGCLPPTEGEKEAIEIMWQRVKLWNTLVELEHKYDEQKEALVAPFITAADDKDHYAEYNAQRKEAFKREDTKVKLVEFQKSENTEFKAIYNNSGLYWGNYLSVTTAWQVARKRPGDLRFHSARDSGKVSVQWPTGMPVADAFDHTSNVLRLNPIQSEAYNSPQRSVRRRLQRSIVSIRIASTPDRKPIWLTLPCVLHRPIPPDGLVRSACVLRERIATHWRWKLVIVVESVPEIRLPIAKGEIALDLGWRKMPDGIRVGMWSDNNGQFSEVKLSNEFVIGMDKTDDIQSIRKNMFNESVARLRNWKQETITLPEWFTERTKTLSLWKAIAKLASLTLFWRDNRFADDESIFTQMEEWRKRDKHLYEYEGNLRDRLLRNRREQYRIFAHWITQHYSKVIIEDFDLRNVTKRKKKGGQADDLPVLARHQRFIAAPSTLRLAIINACQRDGIEVVKKPSADTTRMCCICGNTDYNIKSSSLLYTCPNCAKVLGVKIPIDQDYNASQNLLKMPEKELKNARN